MIFCCLFYLFMGRAGRCRQNCFIRMCPQGFGLQEGIAMEENLSVIFPWDNALEIVIGFDHSGVISYANVVAKEKLGGKEELRGRKIDEIFPNMFKACSSIPGSRFPSGEEVMSLVAYRTNKTCFPVEAKIVTDNLSGLYICLANDMLEREHLGREIEQVREEAQQAMKVKSEFVANVTHELRTPVNGILGNVKELLDEDIDSRVEKSLRLIERCCGDMNKIINNILDFSKLEAGKFTLEPRKFNFRDMLDYVRSNHINKITEKGLGFFMTVSPQIPEHIIGDELRIVQILNNLLSNAQKFTSVGKITVEVVKTAQVKDRMELFFIVKDTGIGIDQEDKDKLFQSFSQVDASISRKYGGTGLGLNISKQLAELMGGAIEVESEKNKGSTFSFSIWVGACEEESSPEGWAMPSFTVGEDTYPMENEGEEDNIKKYGTPENQENLKKVLSKLILCVEMENWEKAEMFMETVRQLTAEAPSEVKRVVLRLKMAIQKENYDKITAEYAELNKFLENGG